MPMSILSYRSTEMVKEFVRDPSRCQHTPMPGHTDLSAQDLADLIEHFFQKREEPGF